VDGREVAEIEQYLKVRTFSRDEADHLVKVLRSRTQPLNKANALGCTPIEIAKAYMRALHPQQNRYDARTALIKHGQQLNKFLV
jgi:hypothetical protein